jgi:hypothetical protein
LLSFVTFLGIANVIRPGKAFVREGGIHRGKQYT